MALTPLGRECGNNWGYLTNPRTRENASQAVYCTEYLWTPEPGKMTVLSPKNMGYNLQPLQIKVKRVPRAYTYRVSLRSPILYLTWSENRTLKVRLGSSRVRTWKPVSYARCLKFSLVFFPRFAGNFVTANVFGMFHSYRKLSTALNQRISLRV